MEDSEYITGEQYELLRCLLKHDVEFMLIGAFAVAYHGFPRDSQDLDIFYNPKKSNVKKLYQALSEFFGELPEEFPDYNVLLEKNALRFGAGKNTTDLLNTISGVTYEEANQSTNRWQHKNIELKVIGRKALIKNKHSSDRPKDTLDALELKKIEKMND